MKKTPWISYLGSFSLDSGYSLTGVWLGSAYCFSGVIATSPLSRQSLYVTYFARNFSDLQNFAASAAKATLLPPRVHEAFLTSSRYSPSSMPRSSSLFL